MSDTERLLRLYEHFNARDMDAALALMHADVAWANAFEGGHVHGRDDVRAYWTRQWATVDSRAEPIRLAAGPAGVVRVEVHLTARDLRGEVVFDKTGVHAFRIEDGLVRRFDIR